MDLTNIIVGQKIKSLRTELGESMELFGKRFDTSKGTVNNWEKGRNLPNNRNLAIIAELAGSTVKDFMFVIPEQEKQVILNKYINSSIENTEEKDFIKEKMFHSPSSEDTELYNKWEDMQSNSVFWETYLDSLKDDFKIKKIMENSEPLEVMEYISKNFHGDFFDSLSTLTNILINYDFEKRLTTEIEKKTFEGMILKFYTYKELIDNLYKIVEESVPSIQYNTHKLSKKQ